MGIELDKEAAQIATEHCQRIDIRSQFPGTGGKVDFTHMRFFTVETAKEFIADVREFCRMACMHVGLDYERYVKPDIKV